MTEHRTGTRDEWLAERRELLDAEKEHMRQGDELARRRQELPWVPIEKEYVFETDNGKKTLADLFDGVIPHLGGHDVTLVAESIALLEELHPYKERMGWRFPWVSSLGSDFKYDFGAAFTEEQRREGAEYNLRHVDQPAPQREGMSAFALEGGVVHHTYSTYDRGVEQLMGTYRMLDLAPLGRNEESPADWWRRHDEYEDAAVGETG